MKNKLIPTLVVTGIFHIAGVFVVTASQDANLGSLGMPATKTVSINTAPAGQGQVTSSSSTHKSAIYNQIMQSQQKMNQKMSKMFDDPFFSSSQSIPPSFFGAGAGQPKTRFNEQENNYILQLALPGLEKKNIAVELKGHMLTVSAKNTANAKNSNSAQQSYSHLSNSYIQSFSIPPGVNASKTSSSYKNGVLTIDFPKNPKNAIQKRIKIPVN